jgi:hypothetical protein
VRRRVGVNGRNRRPDIALPYVDMKTFMEHVLTPAKIIWSVNAVVIDKRGEHDLSPNRRQPDSQWRRRFGRGHECADDPSGRVDPEWNVYAKIGGGRKRGPCSRGSPCL